MSEDPAGAVGRLTVSPRTSASREPWLLMADVLVASNGVGSPHRVPDAVAAAAVLDLEARWHL
jgi:hypothetical protein